MGWGGWKSNKCHSSLITPRLCPLIAFTWTQSSSSAWMLLVFVDREAPCYCVKKHQKPRELNPTPRRHLKWGRLLLKDETPSFWLAEMWIIQPLYLYDFVMRIRKASPKLQWFDCSRDSLTLCRLYSVFYIQCVCVYILFSPLYNISSFPGSWG